MRVPVAVILPTRDRAPQLAAVLQRLAAQVVSPAEVCVVDDGSRDGTDRVAREFGAAYHRLEARGPAAARNAGIAATRSPWLLFLGDDTRPAPDLLAAYGDALEAHGGGPTVALRGSAPFVDERGRQNGIARWLTARTHPPLPPGAPLPPYQFHTANVLVSRAALRWVGGFHEGFPAAAGEDVDLGLRLATAGVRLFYHPECRVDHVHPLTWREFWRRRVQTGRALRLLRARHPRARVFHPPGPRRRLVDPRLAGLGVLAAAATLWGYIRSERSAHVPPLGETDAAGAPPRGGGGDRLQPHGTP